MVRFILDFGPRTHIGSAELDRTGFLCTADRAKQLMLNHMFNVFNSLAPSYLCEEFQRVNHSHYTRHAQHNFIVPRTKGIAKYNFSVVGVKAWNKLPLSIKCIQNKTAFKQATKIFLKNRASVMEQEVFVYY